MTNPALPPLAQMSDLTGARVLVTGGTLGIGAAAARRFDEAGARLVVAARREPTEDVVGAFVRADLATASGVSDLASRTLELLGGIDVVVSNAGSQTSRPDGVTAFSDEDWTRDLDINLSAAVRLDRALLPSMIEQGSGVILHVSSGAARLPRPASVAYTAAKAALTAYSKALAKDVGRHGIRVNCVVPGVILSDALEQRLRATPDDRERFLHELVERWEIPLGRVGSADDAALLMLFLASPAAGYLTGSQYAVDGGVFPTI
jgi:NAD(P)-dependent dehydrogenase (short-subunit alcohol dehydrogenase family)